MTALVFSNYILGALVGWLAAISIGVIGYVFSLHMKGNQRDRRMEGKRELTDLG